VLQPHLLTGSCVFDIEKAFVEGWLVGALLGPIDCSWLNLTGSMAMGCALNSANFTNANVSECNFEGANLTGARFDFANCQGSKMLDTKMDFNTHFTFSKVAGLLISSDAWEQAYTNHLEGGELVSVAQPSAPYA